MAFPIVTVTRPSSLQGKANGKLGDDTVRKATTTGGTATLTAPAHRAWKALATEAERDGHVLVPFSSYRTFATQESLFLGRYKTTFKAGVDTKEYLGQTWFLHTGPVTASPGTSNHGWGLALDLRVNRNGSKVKIDQAAVDWLVANEHRWGFSHELQSEPWHIRYFAGDEVPVTVADVPEEDQEDMTPELQAALAALRTELRAEIAGIRERVDDRSGLVFNQVNTRTGLVYNAVRGLDLGASAEEVDFQEVLAALKAMPKPMVDALVAELTKPP